MQQGQVPGSSAQPLTGTDESTIDDRGRILITKKKRERLGEPFVMVLGDVGCIYAYPADVWNDILQEVRQYPTINTGRQMFTRLVMGWAEDDLVCDQQGRVVVPSRLKTKAGLKKNVTILGAMERLEIWDTEEYAKFLEDEDNYGKERRESIQKAYALMRAG